MITYASSEKSGLSIPGELSNDWYQTVFVGKLKTNSWKFDIYFAWIYIKYIYIYTYIHIHINI